MELLQAFRPDLHAPRLPVAVMQIARVVPARPTAPLWNSIQDQQRLLPKVIPHLAVVPTIDLPNDADAHVSGSRPAGFSIGTPSIVDNVTLAGHRAIVRTALPPPEVATQVLHYGQGTDPYCNITDEAGRAVPAFGPSVLGAKRVDGVCG